MTSLRITRALMLVMVAVLLAVGCATGQVGDGKASGNGISAVPVISPTHTAVQNQTIQANKNIYWIKIDPISDKQVGEIFTINATTNISAGEEISVEVLKSTFSTGPKVQTGEFNGVVGTVRVIQGEAGINRISFVVNSSVLKPDEFLISETTTGKPFASGAVLFNVIPNPAVTGNITLKNFNDLEKLKRSPFFNDIILGRGQNGLIGVIEILMVYGIIGVGILAFLYYRRKGA